MEACNTSNHIYETTWQTLTAQQQASHVAQYILKNLIDSHTQDQQIEENKRKQKKKSG